MNVARKSSASLKPEMIIIFDLYTDLLEALTELSETNLCKTEIYIIDKKIPDIIVVLALIHSSRKHNKLQICSKLFVSLNDTEFYKNRLFKLFFDQQSIFNIIHLGGYNLMNSIQKIAKLNIGISSDDLRNLIGVENITEYGFSEELIAKLVRNDNLEEVLEINRTDDFSIDGMIDTKNEDFLKIYDELSITDYIIFYNSIKLFNYFKNDLKPSKYSLEIAMCNNNAEIIKWVDEKFEESEFEENIFACMKNSLTFMNDEQFAIICHMNKNLFNDKIEFLIDHSILSTPLIISLIDDEAKRDLYIRKFFEDVVMQFIDSCDCESIDSDHSDEADRDFDIDVAKAKTKKPQVKNSRKSRFSKYISKSSKNFDKRVLTRIEVNEKTDTSISQEEIQPKSPEVELINNLDVTKPRLLQNIEERLNFKYSEDSIIEKSIEDHILLMKQSRNDCDSYETDNHIVEQQPNCLTKSLENVQINKFDRIIGERFENIDALSIAFHDLYYDTNCSNLMKVATDIIKLPEYSNSFVYICRNNHCKCRFIANKLESGEYCVVTAEKHTCFNGSCNTSDEQLSKAILKFGEQNMLGLKYITKIRDEVGNSQLHERRIRRHYNALFSKDIKSHSDSWKFLSSFVDNIKLQGGKGEYIEDSNGIVKMVSVSPSFVQDYLQSEACFPVIISDGTFLNNMARGSLIIVVNLSGNRRVIPLAWGWGEGERIEVIKIIFKLVNVIRLETMMSDAGTALNSATESIFQNISIQLCDYHLKNSIHHSNRPMFWKLVKSRCSQEYWMIKQKIIDECPSLHKFLEQKYQLISKFETNAPRHGLLTSGPVEFFNKEVSIRRKEGPLNLFWWIYQ